MNIGLITSQVSDHPKPIVIAAFGTEQRKGTYLKANAANTEAEKVIIADPRLREKHTVWDGLSTYEMTSTYLEQTMEDDSVNTLGINCNKGIIHENRNPDRQIIIGSLGVFG